MTRQMNTNTLKIPSFFFIITRFCPTVTRTCMYTNKRRRTEIRVLILTLNAINENIDKLIVGRTIEEK